MTRLPIFLGSFLALPGVALAHLGHFGELAGHSHWIGLAGLGLAAGLAALLPGRKRKTGDSAKGKKQESAPVGEGETA